jgi:hypothetical protein
LVGNEVKRIEALFDEQCHFFRFKWRTLSHNSPIEVTARFRNLITSELHLLQRENDNMQREFDGLARAAAKREDKPADSARRFSDLSQHHMQLQSSYFVFLAPIRTLSNHCQLNP